eukprot:scaffold159693_cov23-Prasinocladus_malaysianus.AAC.2
MLVDLEFFFLTCTLCKSNDLLHSEGDTPSAFPAVLKSHQRQQSLLIHGRQFKAACSAQAGLSANHAERAASTG